MTDVKAPKSDSLSDSWSQTVSALNAIGLQVETIRVHFERVRSMLSGNARAVIAVVDTLRLDNGGILPEDWRPSRYAEKPRGFVAFVPAAGAASRYFQPVQTLLLALQKADNTGTVLALQELSRQGAGSWALPQSLSLVLSNPELANSYSPDTLRALAQSLELPKALLPCTIDGLSFLAMKQLEHTAVSGIEGQVFVIPADFGQAFPDFGADTIPTCYAEQGPQHSTIRFDAQGAPILEADGRLSIVPAGHGALAGLFPDIAHRFPNCHSLFIRNIDNVMGTGEAALSASSHFLATHQSLLSLIQRIRAALAVEEIPAAIIAAQDILSWQGTPPLTKAGNDFLKGVTADFGPLWELLLRVFGNDPKELVPGIERHGERHFLTLLYRRPVNTFGQVPNNGKDSGGVPVIIRGQHGTERLCLEAAHASAEDREQILSNPAKATHFNPVFVAAELPVGPLPYHDTSDRSVWLLAEKTYRGQAAYYHETALYELLGNNANANTVFVQVPRCIFTPHKTLEDSAGRQTSDWCPR